MAIHAWVGMLRVIEFDTNGGQLVDKDRMQSNGENHNNENSISHPYPI